MKQFIKAEVLERTTMFRHLLYTLALFIFCLGTPASAQSLIKTSNLELSLQNRLYAGAMRHDGSIVSNNDLNRYLLQDYFGKDSGEPRTFNFLTVTPDQICGFRKIELSPLGCALRGADMGAAVGLFAGAVGFSTKAWDERGTWYLVGAMTALGAILGGTKGADDPGFRVRIIQDDP